MNEAYGWLMPSVVIAMAWAIGNAIGALAILVTARRNFRTRLEATMNTVSVWTLVIAIAAGFVALVALLWAAGTANG